MQRNTITFQAIPQWAHPAKADVRALFETLALLGLEGQWLRLSAADQRAIMGGNVFGKQEFMVDADGELFVRRSSCFGMDSETNSYSMERIGTALARGLRVSPGTFGPRYL